MRIWLAERRVELDITQVQAAELAGVSYETYRRAETGEQTPRISNRIKISKALGLPLEMWNEEK